MKATDKPAATVMTKARVAAGDVVTSAPATKAEAPTPQPEMTPDDGARLSTGQKAKVGLDEQRRAAPTTKAPRGPVASFLAEQVRKSRGLDAAKQLASIAA